MLQGRRILGQLSYLAEKEKQRDKKGRTRTKEKGTQRAKQRARW